VATATKFWRGNFQFYRRGSFATKFGQSPRPSHCDFFLILRPHRRSSDKRAAVH